MPPPYRRNPIADAEASFFEEQPRPRFFAPVGQGATSFGSYISPSRAVTGRLRMEEFDDMQDKRSTDAAERFTRRLEMGSRRNLLPHTEAAAMATSQLAKERAESDLRNNPFVEQEQAAESQLQTAQADSGLKNLPGDEAAQREIRDLGLEELRRRDPHAAELRSITKDPGHHLAYDYFLETAPKELKTPEQRQKHAYRQSVRIARDQEAADALEEAILDGKIAPQIADTILEPVTGPDGERFGMRVRNDPKAQAAAARLTAQSRLRRDRQRIANEDRQAERLNRDSTLRAVGKLLDEANETLKLNNTDPAALAAKAKWAKKLEEIMDDGGSTPTSPKGAVDKDAIDAVFGN